MLFSSDYTVPPMQKGWLRARREHDPQPVGWLNDVPPRGGTDPSGAFKFVLGLNVRPDVIYFLTDGEIPGMSADFVAELNKEGEARRHQHHRLRRSLEPGAAEEDRGGLGRGVSICSFELRCE